MNVAMVRVGWTLAAAVCMLATEARRTHAQVAASAAVRSTLTGVYTDEQAGRGKEVYFGSCRSCHTAASHTGATFSKWWKGKRMSELFAFVSQKMPKNDPGSLSAEDYVDVIAYLLKMNAFPVGKDELIPDVIALKDIRIETKRSAPTAATTRAKTTPRAIPPKQVKKP
jgi:mono/diheme cytochrome c family protein